MFAKRGFQWIGLMRCLWGIVARWLLAMLVGFALGLEFGKAYSHPPRPDALGGDRLARVEEAAGKLIEVLPAPIGLSFTHISLLTEVLTVINLAAIFHNTAHLFEL